jgi:uracil DNA glycosylase
LQPSLTSLWDGLSHEFQEELPYEKDLRFLAEQGVLLGNRALNCKLNKTGSFLGKWDNFWRFFFEEIVFHYYGGVPIVFLGKDAAKLRKYVFEMKNPVFVLDHPSFAARSGQLWDTKGVFTKCNKLIVEQFGQGQEIIWDKIKYEELNDLPF